MATLVQNRRPEASGTKGKGGHADLKEWMAVAVPFGNCGAGDIFIDRLPADLRYRKATARTMSR